MNKIPDKYIGKKLTDIGYQGPGKPNFYIVEIPSHIKGYYAYQLLARGYSYPYSAKEFFYILDQIAIEDSYIYELEDLL